MKGADERVTSKLLTGTTEWARNAVSWTPGATMAAIMREALTANPVLLAKERRKPFRARPGALKMGGQ